MEQKEGKKFAADSFRVVGKTTQISFAGAYPQEAGVTQLTRTVNICADGVTLRDDFTFAGDVNTVQMHFLTVCKPELTENGVILVGRYLLKTPAACQVEWKDFEGDARLFDSWQTQGLYRISCSLTAGKTLSSITEIRSI